MDALQAAKWEMVEAGGRTAQSFGLNRLLGQIYVLLYLSDDARSLDDLAEQLGVSKASVSIACRQLESWGALHRSWVKGDRKDYYIAETDFNRILTNGLLTSFYKKLESAKVQIERSLEMLNQNGLDGDKARFLNQRLREADAYRQKVSRLMGNPLVKKLLLGG
jgi:DNA-binding transcriptional regulator GbsR (MarR family)